MKTQKINSLALLLLLALGFFWLKLDTVLAQEGRKIKHEVEPGKWVEIDPYAPAPKTIEGWVEFDPPIPPGKERDPKYPWLPKGPFPYKASWPRKDTPYTGEELAYFQDLRFWWSGKYQDSLIYTPLINRRGLIISKNVFLLQKVHWDDYQDQLDYDEGKVRWHDVMMSRFIIFDNPPEARGLAQVQFTYLNWPGHWKDPSRYVWVPAIRRVRRSAGGDRQDDILGYPVTNDDSGERQPWEEEHTLIAQDVLCTIHHDMGQIVGTVKEIVEGPMNPGAWGEGLNPYREDGCIECWVVMSKHRDPKYYLGYRLTWQEKYTKSVVRQEHYDKQGNLWRVNETGYQYTIGGHLKGGVTKTADGWNDLKRDFRFFAFWTDVIFGKPIPDSKFTTVELAREYFWRPAPNFRHVRKESEYPPYDPLYPEKKSKWRKGIDQIDPKYLAKMKAHNEIWRKRGGFDAWGWVRRTKYLDVK